MDYTKLMEGSDFEYICSKADLLLYQSLSNTLDLFGKNTSESILASIYSQLKTSDFSTYHDLIKKELIHTFGERASDTIMTQIKENIQEEIGYYSNKQIHEILNEIKKEEISRLIQNVKSSEQILLLWKTGQFKDCLFHEFLNRGEIVNLLFSNNSQIQTMRTRIISYSQILENTSVAIQKEIELTNHVCELNNSSMTFVGAEDMTNWFRAGLIDEFLKFRGSNSDYFKEKSLCRLCGIDMNQNVGEETMRKVLHSYNTIIIEEPLSAYKRKV